MSGTVSSPVRPVDLAAPACAEYESLEYLAYRVAVRQFVAWEVMPHQARCSRRSATCPGSRLAP